MTGAAVRMVLASAAEPRIVVPPRRADLFLGEAEVVGRRDEREGPLDPDHDEAADPRAGIAHWRSAVLVKGEDLVEDRALGQDRGLSLEPVALPGDGIDDVDLDGRVGPQVRNSPRRHDVGEHEVLVVPDPGRPLGGQAGSPVRAHRGHEPQPLLADHPLHVLGQNRALPVVWRSTLNSLPRWRPGRSREDRLPGGMGEGYTRPACTPRSPRTRSSRRRRPVLERAGAADRRSGPGGQDRRCFSWPRRMTARGLSSWLRSLHGSES